MCESDTLQKYKHLQNANIHQEMNLQKKQSARFLEVTLRPYKWSQGNSMPDLFCIKALQTWQKEEEEFEAEEAWSKQWIHVVRSSKADGPG